MCVQRFLFGAIRVLCFFFCSAEKNIHSLYYSMEKSRFLWNHPNYICISFCIRFCLDHFPSFIMDERAAHSSSTSNSCIVLNTTILKIIAHEVHSMDFNRINCWNFNLSQTHSEFIVVPICTNLPHTSTYFKNQMHTNESLDFFLDGQASDNSRDMKKKRDTEFFVVYEGEIT